MFFCLFEVPTKSTTIQSPYDGTTSTTTRTTTTKKPFVIKLFEVDSSRIIEVDEEDQVTVLCKKSPDNVLNTKNFIDMSYP